MVVRNDLFGLQSSAERGECSQTGHDEGRFAWPEAQLAPLPESEGAAIR